MRREHVPAHGGRKHERVCRVSWQSAYGRCSWQVHVPFAVSVCVQATVARLSVQLAGGSRPQHFRHECLFVREARVLYDVGRGGGQRIGLGVRACVFLFVCVCYSAFQQLWSICREAFCSPLSPACFPASCEANLSKVC